MYLMLIVLFGGILELNVLIFFFLYIFVLRKIFWLIFIMFNRCVYYYFWFCCIYVWDIYYLFIFEFLIFGRF